MRMPEYKFVAELVADVGDVEIARLAAYLGVEDDVKEHVAELLADVRFIVLDDGVGQLVCLLNGVWAQALVGLLAVPRTFCAQVVHDVEQTSEGL